MPCADYTNAVLDALKAAAKKLPYPLFLRVFYGWYAATELRQARRALRRASIPLLTREAMLGEKKSDTLFALGGGSSINQITADRWAAIAKCDSIGINFWPLHPFVPTYYVFEKLAAADHPQGYALMMQMLARRAQEYRGTIKIVMEFHRRGEHVLDDFPADFLANLYAAFSIPAPARSRQELNYALHHLDRRQAFSARGSFSHLLKYAATLTTVLALAAKLEYRQVVLCGIDLRSQEYFFQDPNLFPETAEISLVPRAQPHATNLALDWRLPAEQVVPLIRETILAPRGIKLYVENRSSALWPAIPDAPQDLFSQVKN